MLNNLQEIRKKELLFSKLPATGAVLGSTSKHGMRGSLVTISISEK